MDSSDCHAFLLVQLYSRGSIHGREGRRAGCGGQVALLAIWSSICGSGRVIFPLPRASKAFVEFLKARIEAGEYRAVINRRYALDEIVAAYRYVETSQKVGNFVVDVISGDRISDCDSV